MTAAEKRLLDQMLMDGCSRADLFAAINAMLLVRIDRYAQLLNFGCDIECKDKKNGNGPR